MAPGKLSRVFLLISLGVIGWKTTFSLFSFGLSRSCWVDLRLAWGTLSTGTAAGQKVSHPGRTTAAAWTMKKTTDFWVGCLGFVPKTTCKIGLGWPITCVTELKDAGPQTWPFPPLLLEKRNEISKVSVVHWNYNALLVKGYVLLVLWFSWIEFDWNQMKFSATSFVRGQLSSYTGRQLFLFLLKSINNQSRFVPSCFARQKSLVQSLKIKWNWRGKRIQSTEATRTEFTGSNNTKR